MVVLLIGLGIRAQAIAKAQTPATAASSAEAVIDDLAKKVSWAGF